MATIFLDPTSAREASRANEPGRQFHQGTYDAPQALGKERDARLAAEEAQDEAEREDYTPIAVVFGLVGAALLVISCIAIAIIPGL